MGKSLTTSQGVPEPFGGRCPCSGCPVHRCRRLINARSLHIFNADPCLSIDRMNKNWWIENSRILECRNGLFEHNEHSVKRNKSPAELISFGCSRTRFWRSNPSYIKIYEYGCTVHTQDESGSFRIDPDCKGGSKNMHKNFITVFWSLKMIFYRPGIFVNNQSKSWINLEFT